MIKYRCVPEQELIDILEAAHKYWALEAGGVDNWNWYCDSLLDYLKASAAETNLNPDDDDWDFVSIAKQDLDKYPTAFSKNDYIDF